MLQKCGYSEEPHQTDYNGSYTETYAAIRNYIDSSIQTNPERRGILK